MANFEKIVITSICAVFTLSATPEMSYAGKSVKKDKRSMMTEAQKKDLRARAREWCKKNYAVGNSYVDSVTIMSDGRVMCRYRY